MKLRGIVWDADLRGRQGGLAVQMKQSAKLTPADLDPGEVVVFVNRTRDKIAVLAGVAEDDSRGVMSYYVSPHGRCDMLALKYIPRSLGASGHMDMNEATRQAILERFRKKGRDYTSTFTTKRTTSENRAHA